MSRRYQSAILTASYNGLQVPNAPTIGTATAGAGSASVAFTAPANVGGSAITSYTVISSPGSITGTGASSPITVSGLTNDTAYTFTVVATNAYGSGPASAASNSVTPTVNYIENVFSTWLYTGTGAALTITNGINLSGKGGLVWFKNRNSTNNHALYDTARGATKRLSTSQTGGTGAQVTDPTSLTAFNSNGFSIGSDNSQNENTFTFASWTFREQEKFLDIVTWTGNGANRTIAHNLGSVPGCIIVKRTDATANWAVYHRSLTNTQYLDLNNNNDVSNSAFFWNSTTPTSTVFSLGNDDVVNFSGGTYVAYVFAHNAGGFGLSSTDNVISCASFTTDGSGNATVNLGYEPQWILFKSSNGFSNWFMYDNMRGFGVTSGSNNYLLANSSGAENNGGSIPLVTSTGFSVTAAASTTYVYIAIRKGPMAVPTVGTSVYNGIARTGNGTATTVSNSGFTPDMVMSAPRTAGPSYGLAFPFDRLRGALKLLETRSTQAEQTGTGTLTGFDTMNGYIVGTDASGYGAINADTVTYINWNFQRAPSFFDEVCYTGTGANRTVTHNLGVAPELMITKSRSGAYDWAVYAAGVGNTSYGLLNDPGQFYVDSSAWNNTSPTSSVFTVGTGTYMNGSGATYVAYLFATCVGVSKVGSYTGTGALQTINCAFTTGARFVLIKRTDSTGDWYVWDSARGITAGNDPYLLLNNLAAEVTGTNYVDSTAAGFQVTAAAPAGINAVGGTYIFLAIA